MINNIVISIFKDLKRMRKMQKDDKNRIGNPLIDQELIKERISYFNGGICAALHVLNIIKIWNGKLYVMAMRGNDD